MITVKLFFDLVDAVFPASNLTRISFLIVSFYFCVALNSPAETAQVCKHTTAKVFVSLSLTHNISKENDNL